MGCRVLEIFYLTIGQLFNMVMNLFKLLTHFRFNNPNRKIKSIDDLNLRTYKKFRLLSSDSILLTHFRLAKMFDKYINIK